MPKEAIPILSFPQVDGSPTRRTLREQDDATALERETMTAVLVHVGSGPLDGEVPKSPRRGASFRREGLRTTVISVTLSILMSVLVTIGVMRRGELVALARQSRQRRDYQRELVDLPLEKLETPSDAPKVIHIVLDDSAGYPAHPYSLFLANVASQYGTGRVAYETIHIDTKTRASFTRSVPAPCVLLTKSLQRGHEWRIKAAPHCKIFLVADEFCAEMKTERSHLVQIRQYDGKPLFPNGNNSVYVPLGPRADFARAFRNRNSTLVEPFARRYILNAIYSEDTSPSRVELSHVLEEDKEVHDLLKPPKTKGDQGEPSAQRAVIQIAKAWTKKLGEDHLSSDQYAVVLTESIFTLSPCGHNPESYRFFEAIEAGSIPVIALDSFYKSHVCGDPLWRLRESGAPIVFLNRWSDLGPTLRRILSNPGEVRAMQKALRLWYFKFMRERMQAMENKMLA